MDVVYLHYVNLKASTTWVSSELDNVLGVIIQERMFLCTILPYNTTIIVDVHGGFSKEKREAKSNSEINSQGRSSVRELSSMVGVVGSWCRLKKVS